MASIDIGESRSQDRREVSTSKLSLRTAVSVADMDSEYHPRTLEYVLKLSREHRKRLGQFFTPRSLREELLSRIPRLVKPRVVDPACGTGEFLLSAREYFIDPELYCWDIDAEVIKLAKDVLGDGVVFEVVDSLLKPFIEEFVVVVGNPPYFEFKPGMEVLERYGEVVHGRVNIYALFVYLGLRILKPGGYLAYVVSSSMNSGAYFSKLRDFVLSVADIEYLRVVPNPRIFEDVSHTFQLLVLRKRIPGEQPRVKYVVEIGGRRIFTEYVEEVKRIWEGSVSLRKLGYRVATGRIIWNQHKDKLTEDPREGVLLIWAHNIGRGRLLLDNKVGKPQYIRWGGTRDVGPAIVVRRVVGHPCKPKLRAAVIPPGMEFLAENHVNVVYPPKDATIEELETVAEVLNSEEIQKYVSMVIGNTQVSARELENLIPIPREVEVYRTPALV